MKTSPLLSTATSSGLLSPDATVVWVPSGCTSTTRLLPESAMNTSPAASTAVRAGRESPDPMVETALVGSTPERLGAKSAAPQYEAVMSWAPTGRVVVVNVA